MEAITKGASTAEHCRVLLMALAICSGAELAMQHNALESKKTNSKCSECGGGSDMRLRRRSTWPSNPLGHLAYRTGTTSPNTIRSEVDTCRKPSSWECPGSRQRGGRRTLSSLQPPPMPFGKQTHDLDFRHCCVSSACASRAFGGWVEACACLCKMSTPSHHRAPRPG